MCYVQRNKDKDDSTFLTRNNGKEKTVEQIFKVLKKKNYQPRFLYPSKVAFQKDEGGTKMAELAALSSHLSIETSKSSTSLSSSSSSS